LREDLEDLREATDMLRQELPQIVEDFEQYL
jgi:hypothetical protein